MHVTCIFTGASSVMWIVSANDKQTVYGFVFLVLSIWV